MGTQFPFGKVEESCRQTVVMGTQYYDVLNGTEMYT
jgi:hypothetical protein